LFIHGPIHDAQLPTNLPIYCGKVSGRQPLAYSDSMDSIRIRTQEREDFSQVGLHLAL